MVRSTAKTVEEYLRQLPADKQSIVADVRDTILKNLPLGYEEVMNWGMISYEVPLKRYPKTYNGEPLLYAALAAQKNNYSLYLMGIYQNEELEKNLRSAYEKIGKKLDMGKSCIRFKKLEDLPLNVVGEIIASVPVEAFIETYEKSREVK